MVRSRSPVQFRPTAQNKNRHYFGDFCFALSEVEGHMITGSQSAGPIEGPSSELPANGSERSRQLRFRGAYSTILPMAKAKRADSLITMRCTVCKRRNYYTH